MSRARTYASSAVLAQLATMTSLRDRDASAFVTAEERTLESWEARASFRRSRFLRREAQTLQTGTDEPNACALFTAPTVPAT